MSDELRDVRTERDRLWAALAELIRLKDIKDALEHGGLLCDIADSLEAYQKRSAAIKDYEESKPKAWAEARAAIAAFAKVKSDLPQEPTR